MLFFVNKSLPRLLLQLPAAVLPQLRLLLLPLLALNQAADSAAALNMHTGCSGHTSA
jgi:hypothetical protein